MSQVTPEEMVDFFLYCTEVNWQVLNARSDRMGRLCKVVTANDLSGIDLFGDATFRKALSASSKQGNALYPSLTGPTLLLNLPKLLGALVKVFKPLFPPAVQKKLKFEQGPLGDVQDLTSLLTPTSPSRDKFLSEIQALL
uniref:CRAL-TRIO domain-containing protein n=1 Tax=Rhizochromulina marina TaxID=1034831 RepID=A0A7S2WAI5_9STRA|mmetsp:Transcript_18834/g.54827  ORF Transcript_18834/g.54827 Transcript_18834/m.54827 type:complete len:140 (+) Transcript_18834:1-420(+)